MVARYKCRLNVMSKSDKTNINVLVFLMQNRVINGVYPVSPESWFVTAAVVVGLFLFDVDVSFGCWSYLRTIPR